MKNAGQNPILRLLPKQPTPNANPRAMMKKNKLSASISINIYRVNKIN